jgi:DNA-directed RNA polymerase specialized sigma24 family protein
MTARLHPSNMLDRVTRKVVPRYLRRCPWTKKDDLVNEAMVAMLDALPRYDGVRSLEGFLFGAAQRAVHRYAWRQGSALHVCPRMASDLPGEVRRTQEAAQPEEALAFVGVAHDVDEVEDADVRARLAARVAELLAQDREGEVARDVLLGGKPATVVAKERALPVRRVQAAAARVRDRIADDARVFVLYEQSVRR